MQVGVHKVVGEEHLQVRVDAERHDLRVEGGRGPHVARDGRAAFKGFHEHGGGWRHILDDRGKDDGRRDGRKVAAEASDVLGFHAQVGLGGHSRRKLGEGFLQGEAAQAGQGGGSGSERFEEREIHAHAGRDAGVGHFDGDGVVGVADEGGDVDLGDRARGKRGPIKPRKQPLDRPAPVRRLERRFRVSPRVRRGRVV